MKKEKDIVSKKIICKCGNNFTIYVHKCSIIKKIPPYFIQCPKCKRVIMIDYKGDQI